MAGFYVVGVDMKPQPHYVGDDFIQADALEYLSKHGREFDVIHASPPCQRYTRLNKKYREKHPDLIAPVREGLISVGRPYVIENVPDAARLLINPLMLCGSMFNLPIERHRFFETSFRVIPDWSDRLYCRHIPEPVLVSGVSRRKGKKRREYGVEECRKAMCIPWMIREELDEAIPPAYTEYIGKYLSKLIAK